MNSSTPPKIVHIASGDLWAGAESQLFTLVKTLHLVLGVPVTVVLFNHGMLESKLRDIHVPVKVIDESRVSVFRLFAILLRTIREFAPDVVHTHRIKENILGSIAAFFASRTPSIRTVHGNPLHGPYKQQAAKRLLGSVNRLAGCYIQRRVVSVSAELAEILCKDYPPAKIRVIENGIDLDYVNRRAASGVPPRSQNAKMVKIGFAGRLVSVKRVDLVIEIARHILDHYQDIRPEFLVYGEGPLLEPLQQQSQQLGTDTSVKFAGHVDNIHQKLKELDILLITSDHEGLPMVLLEAMALQTPVIAHAVGDITKVLDHGTCGILVRDQNVADYADQIHRLVVSQELRSKITARALHRVTNEYSALKNARAYLDEYTTIAESKI